MKKVLVLTAVLVFAMSNLAFAGSKAGTIISNTKNTGMVNQGGGGVKTTQELNLGGVEMEGSKAGTIISNTENSGMINQMGGGVKTTQKMNIGGVKMK